MAIPYPNKPWNDGQSFEYTAGDGSKVTASYDATKNAWTFARIESGSSSGGGGVAGVSSIIAGTGIAVDQATGDVTITATGSGGTGAVSSVNSKTGDVVLTTSDLSNDSGYVTDAGVTSIIAGTNITVSDNGSGAVTINSTASGGGGGAVDSVNGQTGVVILGINNLTDVQTSGGNHDPSDGDALVWDAGMSHWMPGSFPKRIDGQEDFAYNPSSNTAELLGPTSNYPPTGANVYTPIPNSNEGNQDSSTFWYEISSNPGFHNAMLSLSEGDDINLNWWNVGTEQNTATTFRSLTIVDDNGINYGKLIINSTLGTFSEGNFNIKFESPHIVNGVEPLKDGDVLQFDLDTAKWTAKPLPVTTLSSYPTLP